MTLDLIGLALRRAGTFKGRGRVERLWLATTARGVRDRHLPGGGLISCDVSIPYEAMIWLGCEEHVELALLRRLVKSGDTFVDCGANLGLWALTAAPTASRVLAIEPNPLTCEQLRRNIIRSGFQNIDVIEAALGNRDGEVCLSTGREHNLSRLSSRGVPVVLTTLDAVVGEQPVSGVKIDVEGFELQVLEGAEGVLGQKPWVVVEFNTILTGEKELSDWDVHGFLTERGYKPASVSDPGSLLPDDSEVFGYLNLLYRSRADWMP